MSSDHKTDQVLAALRRIVRAIELHSRQLEQRCGLTAPQLVLLRELALHTDEDLVVTKMAQRISLSQATVTGIVNRLEARGLVRRERSDADRRRVVLRITAEGLRAVATAPALLQERFIFEFEKLEEWEQTGLLSSLQRIAAFMDAEDVASKPVLLAEDSDAPPAETMELWESRQETDGPIAADPPAPSNGSDAAH